MSGRRPASRWRGAACLLASLLAACGGTSGDAESPPAGEARPTLSGRVASGRGPTDLRGLQVTVKGRTGTARTAEGRIVPVAGTDYEASLDQLDGPYLLSDSARSPSSLSLYSVATAPGTANLTPLTTLLVAELLGAEPTATFESLGNRGGVDAAIDEAAVAAAESRLRRRLQRDHGFVVPAALGPFATTRFSPVAGDPMADTVEALVAMLGSSGDIGALVAEVAQEAGRCRLERVDVRAPGSAEGDDFCPLTRRNDADAGDAGLRVHAFANQRGDTLTLRLRADAVVDLVLRDRDGTVAGCSAGACAGVDVGAPAADGSQSIGFAATPLGGTGRVALTLTGRLRTAVPGLALPGLPCTDNRFYLIDEAAAQVDGYCAAPAGLGLGESGPGVQSGATRRRYDFSDGVGGPTLEVMVQGDRVVSALVHVPDPVTGAATPRAACRGTGCAQLTLGPRVVDQSLGVPVVLQPVRADRAAFDALAADGTPTGGRLLVEATLTGYHVEDPNALPLVPVACGGGAASVSAQASDEAAPIVVCEPADPQGFTLRSTTLDADGNTVLSLAGLLSDGNGSLAVGNGINLTLSPAGTLLSATYDAFFGPAYRCRGAGCSGIVVSPPGAGGERSVSLTGAVLGEVGTAGLAGDRTARLDGAFVAPEP